MIEDGKAGASAGGRWAGLLAPSDVQEGFRRYLLEHVWKTRLLIILAAQLSGLLAIGVAFDLPVLSGGAFGAQGGLGDVALARLPLLLSPVLTLTGLWALKHKPGAVAGLGLATNIVYTVLTDLGFYLLGYPGSPVHSISLLVATMIGQSLVPLSRRHRFVYLLAFLVGHVALELAFASSLTGIERLMGSAALIAGVGYSIIVAEILAGLEFRSFTQFKGMEVSLEGLRSSRGEAEHASALLGRAVADLSFVTGGLSAQAAQSNRETKGMASGIEQLAGSAREVSGSARSSARAVGEARGEAAQIEKLVGNSDRRVEAVLAAVDASSTSIERLERSVASIQEFVDTIEDIAQQSNLLALNASLEAVRAGELGVGFRVVASEMLKLAGTSRERTQVVRKVVKAVVQDLRVTVGTVVEVRESAERFQGDFDGVRTGLAALLEQLRQVDATIDQATTQSGEQAVAVQQLSEAALSVARLMESNAQASGRLTETAAELQRLAERLSSTVAAG